MTTKKEYVDIFLTASITYLAYNILVYIIRKYFPTFQGASITVNVFLIICLVILRDNIRE